MLHPERNNDLVWLYLVGSDGEFFKVGYSENVTRRLQALQIGNPHRLRVWWKSVRRVRRKEAKRREYAALKEWSEHRAEGEWLHLESSYDVGLLIEFLENGRQTADWSDRT